MPYLVIFIDSIYKSDKINYLQTLSDECKVNTKVNVIKRFITEDLTDLSDSVSHGDSVIGDKRSSYALFNK